MDLKLYDTLTRQKRPFAPLDPANVRMYVCGPTVYDFAHIGNARPVIVFDVLFRLLRHLYGPEHVTYVRNITDVDDKINARAAEEYPDLPLNEAIRKVTEQTEKQFHEDVAALGCLPPTIEPRATEHIAEMKALIERLVASGHAYVADDHVLFHVPSMPDYGKLAKRSLDEMVAGARVEVAPYKRDPQDFVLWKPSNKPTPLWFWAMDMDFKPSPLWVWAIDMDFVLRKPSKPGEPEWASPCGIKSPGRPGWHIECSAMSWRHLGETFDIHGGGIDLVFPHHENEIAQSRSAFHTPVMANYWMHNGFLQVEGEKMSKSLGNFVTIRDSLQVWSGEAIRLNMLKTHYHQPIDWTVKALEESWRELRRWAVNIIGVLQFDKTIMGQLAEFEVPNIARMPPSADIIEALSDDLNTPDALTALRARKLGLNSQVDALQLLSDLKFLGLLSERTLRIYTRPINANPQAAALFREEINALGTASANRDTCRIKHIVEQLREQGADVREVTEGRWRVHAGGPAADEFNRKVQDLIIARGTARLQKNFAEADRIRDELAAMGVLLKDSKDGTTWEVAR